MIWLWFIPLAFIGVATRHLLAEHLSWGLPLSMGVLLANVVGSLALGWLATHSSLFLSTHIIAALGVALLGGLTTFSGFALETVRLIQQSQYLWAGANILVHNGLCIGFCYLGVLLAKTS